MIATSAISMTSPPFDLPRPRLVAALVFNLCPPQQGGGNLNGASAVPCDVLPRGTRLSTPLHHLPAIRKTQNKRQRRSIQGNWTTQRAPQEVITFLPSCTPSSIRSPQTRTRRQDSPSSQNMTPAISMTTPPFNLPRPRLVAALVFDFCPPQQEGGI